MIKVSVIVPVYNVEKYLPKCLDSLINQSLKEIEIIIVNDGSTDGSQKIIDKYVKKYPKKIKFFIKDNGGLSSARNYGMKKACGQFIAFVDSDDWVDSNMLEDMYIKATEENSDIVICDMIQQFANSSAKYCNCTKFSSIYAVTPSACNKIFSKKIIGDKTFLDGIWYEDLNFTTKILLQEPKISTISKGYYHYRISGVSITNNNNSLKNLDIIKSMDDLIEYSIEKNIYEKSKSSVEFLIIEHILLSSINRVAVQHNKDKKYVINCLINYCHKKVPKYLNNEYYKKWDINKRIIVFLNFNRLYMLSRLLLFIKSKLK